MPIPDIPTYAFSDMSVAFWFKGAVSSAAFIGQDDGPGSQPKWVFAYGYANPGKFEFHLNGAAPRDSFPATR